LALYKPSGVAVVPAAKAKLDYPARPERGRWIAVSPPDTNAAGLVVLTTDGKLANRLTRASAIEQEFAVRLLGLPTPAQIQRMTDGMSFEERAIAAESMQPAGGGARNVWFHIVLRAGPRELRGLLDAAGLSVSRIIRIRFGPVKLGTMRRGQSRPLTRPEIDRLNGLAAEGNAAPGS
jgi:23S rRNA pseudouridine2605 synthase